MDYPIIDKPPIDEFRVRPNLDDYERIRAAFHYPDVIKELDGLPGGGLNIAYEAIDRHVVARARATSCAGSGRARTATSRHYTLRRRRSACRTSSRTCWAKLGIAKGDRVFCFMDRVPELYAAVFGTLKAGCVTGPLFSAFGPDAAGDRLADAGAKVLVTSPEQRAKVAAMKPNLPELKHIIIVDHGKEPQLEPGELSWNELMKDASTSTRSCAPGRRIRR